ncbi:hypothetical protein Glove_465g63 [Diversispora epigaea]|uniref:CRAL-TRIO domain-containing protein n=1 Tax=Diversispora epigaea TaxID=1348612 RepID=A0A397GRB7_9GLOM|nr:hypothetical protein Glove_465g63 [Diversispora epigaea]
MSKKSTTKSNKNDILEGGVLTLEGKAQVIKEFRELLGKDNDKYDDECLIRFAVARSFQLDKAKQQLEDTTAWRESEGIESIPLPLLNPNTPVLYNIRGFEPYLPDWNLTVIEGVPDYVPRILNCFGGNAVHKTDKDGRGVYIERLGLHDAKKLAKDIKVEELVNWHIRCQEFSHRVLMPELSKRAGNVIDKETIIFDCDGMGLHQLHMPALSLYRAIADLDQRYYPERLGKLFVVNTPFMFVTLWSLVKKWLDPGMLKKVHICGKDFKETLLKNIDAENLPTFLGGNCTCSHMPGGCVPSVILKNIPPFKIGETLPSQSSSSHDLKSNRILKGDSRSYEVIVANDDEKSNGNNIEINFKILEGEGEVKLEVRFNKLNGSDVKNGGKKIMPPKKIFGSKSENTYNYKIKTKETGEYLFILYFNEAAKSDSCVIEHQIKVNNEPYEY